MVGALRYCSAKEWAACSGSAACGGKPGRKGSSHADGGPTRVRRLTVDRVTRRKLELRMVLEYEALRSSSFCSPKRRGWGLCPGRTPSSRLGAEKIHRERSLNRVSQAVRARPETSGAQMGSRLNEEEVSAYNLSNGRADVPGGSPRTVSLGPEKNEEASDDAHHVRRGMEVLTDTSRPGSRRKKARIRLSLSARSCNDAG